MTKSNTEARLISSAHVAVSLYGIMVSEAITVAQSTEVNVDDPDRRQ